MYYFKRAFTPSSSIRDRVFCSTLRREASRSSSVSGFGCCKLLLWSSELFLVAVFVFQPKSHRLLSYFRCCLELLLRCFLMAAALPWRRCGHAAAVPSQVIFLFDFKFSTSFWNHVAHQNVVTSQCGVAVTVPACILRARFTVF
jgi:hypothetical protein